MGMTNSIATITTNLNRIDGHLDHLRSHTSGDNLGKSHILIQHITYMVATLLTVSDMAASSFC